MKPIRNYNVKIVIRISELIQLKIKLLQISSAKIINPSGNVVSIWENLPMTFGLLQLEHQLNEDTLLVRIQQEFKLGLLKTKYRVNGKLKSTTTS